MKMKAGTGVIEPLAEDCQETLAAGKRQGRLLPWHLQRRHSPALALISDF